MTFDGERESMLHRQVLLLRWRISFGHAWKVNPDETLSLNGLEKQT